MPISADYKNRLYPILKDIARHYKTPFHIYDEIGIRNTAEELTSAFSGGYDFREYFAVKALPNLRILEVIKNVGFGFDCSSIPELVLSRMTGAVADDIMFTSNNTSEEEFRFSMQDGGSILNLDDITLLEKLKELPHIICFRYNPGEERSGNRIIGNPAEAKYGLTRGQLEEAYKKCRDEGIERFGIHTMLISNELDYKYMVETLKMLLDIAEFLSSKLGISFEFINIGGGIGIPYKYEEKDFDLKALGKETDKFFAKFYKKNGYMPKLFLESGRYMTGNHGVLVTTAINRKDTYKKYIGVDACMSSLMRPGIYGAYHHIDVYGKEEPDETVDVVGSLCENMDKFAIDRKLPKIENGDILIIHDTGAHGYSMGFNYNGRLRPKELFLGKDGRVELIRREETLEDYLATFDFVPDIMESF